MSDPDRTARLEQTCRALVKALKLSNAYALGFAAREVGGAEARKMLFNVKAEAALFEASGVLPDHP
jgi:hypothetical protein